MDWLTTLFLIPLYIAVGLFLLFIALIIVTIPILLVLHLIYAIRTGDWSESDDWFG